MDPQLDPVHFFTAGFSEYGELVPARVAAEAILAFTEALDEITKNLSPKEQAVSWPFQEIEIGSLAVSLQPQPETAVGPLVADQAVDRFVHAMHVIHSGGDLEQIVPKRAAESIMRLQSFVDQGELQPIYIRRGQTEASFQPASVPLREDRKWQSLGSIEGEITTVSFATAPYFVVRTRLDNASVRCSFDPQDLYSDVVDNLRRRVAVWGLVTKRSDGVPTSMSQVERIYVYPSRDDLPQPDDILGLD